MSTVSGKAFDIGLLGRVMRFVRPYKRLFILTFILTIVLSGLSVVKPLLIANMIDEHALQGDEHGLLLMLLLVIGLLVVEAFLQYYNSYWTSWLGQTVGFDLRDSLYKHVISLKLRYFDRTPIGTLVTRVVSDMETIQSIFSEGLLLILGDILQLIVVVVVMFVVDWRLALLSLLPIPLLLVATNIFKNSIRGAFQDVRTQVSRLNAFVQEHIQGMHIVQVFGRQEQEYLKFQAINKDHRNAHIRSVWAYSIFFPVVEILSAISLALLVWWGVGGVINEQVSFGDLVAYILFINMLFRPIRQLADRFNTLQMGMVGSDRVFKVLDTQERIADTGKLPAEQLRGDIEFRDLWFAYIDEDWVLRNVSFQVKAGETVALVGATGSGKTSIINVLSRSYEFQKGQVLIDGNDIREYALPALRANIAVVLQDVFLFSDTIHNNITLNDPNITRDMVVEASKVVGAHGFISQLLHGYDTDVKERGGMLSVGQRQLISFIRAYVHKPQILVLDEATSSVDSASEILIQDATEKITKGRTSIVIAHRLSTIQNADRIIVLEKGRIIEQGNHQELLEKGGRYRQLYELQFR